MPIVLEEVPDFALPRHRDEIGAPHPTRLVEAQRALVLDGLRVVSRAEAIGHREPRYLFASRVGHPCSPGSGWRAASGRWELVAITLID